jgi:hypothetical protein
MMAKETAADRRAREAVEAREAQARWEAQRPMRLLRVLARANDLGLFTNLYIMDDDIHITITSQDCTYYHHLYLSELTEWQMQALEQDMEDREQEKQRQARLNEIRQDVLNRLTQEEKEALGIK